MVAESSQLTSNPLISLEIQPGRIIIRVSPDEPNDAMPGLVRSLLTPEQQQCWSLVARDDLSPTTGRFAGWSVYELTKD